MSKKKEKFGDVVGAQSLPEILTKNLDLSDVACHICLGILIEPVTLPCQHRMCKVCKSLSLALKI